jgi:uncharacterized membrane protein YfcA
MTDPSIIFYLLLFIVAFLYASVGHGGASGYLALMALFAMSPAIMKPTALILNIFVSLIAFVQFYKARHFLWRLFLPLAITSFPMAFIGGLITVEQDVYKKILAIMLLFAILRFVSFRNIEYSENRKHSVPLALLIGAAIGVISGMIGIGGGIILSPILLLLKWTNLKQAAAISALFIFVNSISGFAGQVYKGLQLNNNMIAFVVIALAGGILGSYFGARKFNQLVLKRVLAGVLLIAVVKLLTV